MSADPIDALPLQIGAKVRTLRNAKGLSGRKLAAAAGVSQPFLSQLESGQTSVSLATLYRIAKALDVTAPDLLASPRDEGVEVWRRTEFTHMTVGDDATSVLGTGIFRSDSTITELFDYVIEPGQHIAEWFETTGEHGVYCIEGCIRVEFDVYDDVILDAGDVLFYRGPNRHRWHLKSDSRARVILIATEP